MIFLAHGEISLKPTHCSLAAKCKVTHLFVTSLLFSIMQYCILQLAMLLVQSVLHTLWNDAISNDLE